MRSDGTYAKLEAPPTGAVLEWKDLLAIVLWPLTDKLSEGPLDLMAEILVIDSQERQLRPGDTWSISAKQLLSAARIA